MLYKVVKPFIDKTTQKYHALGSMYECKNAKRVAELEKGGFIFVPPNAKKGEDDAAED